VASFVECYVYCLLDLLCFLKLIVGCICLLLIDIKVFEDLYHYMQSLATIQSLNPSRIYPGHGPVVLDPQNHVKMYIDNRNNREKQIIAALSSVTDRTSRSAMDLVKVIYTVRAIYFVFHRWSGL
jgi:hypothetical protein